MGVCAGYSTHLDAVVTFPDVVRHFLSSLREVHSMSRHRPWQGIVLILALFLAACGSPGATTETVTQPTAAAEPTTAPAAAEPTTADAAAEPTTAPAAAEPTTAAAEPATGSTTGILNGVTLPADAAPAEQQVYVVHYDNTADFTTIDLFESVYKRGGAVADILSDSLVRLDKNFKVNPGAALSWEVDSTGLIWTFKLDPNLIWTDDTPVTADDYVATFRYAAIPNMAGTSPGSSTA